MEKTYQFTIAAKDEFEADKVKTALHMIYKSATNEERT